MAVGNALVGGMWLECVRNRNPWKLPMTLGHRFVLAINFSSVLGPTIHELNDRDVRFPQEPILQREFVLPGSRCLGRGCDEPCLLVLCWLSGVLFWVLRWRSECADTCLGIHRRDIRKFPTIPWPKTPPLMRIPFPGRKRWKPNSNFPNRRWAACCHKRVVGAKIVTRNKSTNPT